MVLGEFNHGKSTFINALLGEPLLPTGITPTTAVLAHVSHGPRRGGDAGLRDRRARGRSIRRALGDWLTVEGAGGQTGGGRPASACTTSS